MTRLPIIRMIAVASCCAVLMSCAGRPQVRTYYSTDRTINRSAALSVVPAKIGKADDLVLPDAISTELLRLGFNVVERTTVRQMVHERGLELTEMLNGEEYLKLGSITQVSTLIIVNATSKGEGVANATVKAVDTSSGAILWSTTYSQPSPNNPHYIYHDTLIDTAQKIAGEIAKSFSGYQN